MLETWEGFKRNDAKIVIAVTNGLRHIGICLYHVQDAKVHIFGTTYSSFAKTFRMVQEHSCQGLVLHQRPRHISAYILQLDALVYMPWNQIAVHCEHSEDGTLPMNTVHPVASISHAGVFLVLEKL